MDNELKALIHKAKGFQSTGLYTEVFTKCSKSLIYKVKIKNHPRMDTFESISERKNPALGHQSGYNAGQQAAEQVQQQSLQGARESVARRKACESTRAAEQSSAAASGAGGKKQIPRKAERLDKPNETCYTAKH